MKLPILIRAFCFATLFVPFVLINDVYPFFRFGMFAELVRPYTPNESFQLWCGDRLIVGDDIGLNDDIFTYLVRNHVYRNECDELLQKMKGMKRVENQGSWRLIKISGQDTTQLCTTHE